MKKLYLLAIITALVCVFSLYGCTPTEGGGSDTPAPKQEITLTKSEVTLVKGQSDTVTVVSEKKLDTLSLKWSCSNDNVVFYKKEGVNLQLKGLAEGEAILTLKMSGKEIAALKVNVVMADLTVRLPEGKIVLSKGSTATVQAHSIKEGSGDYVWQVSCDGITVESQGKIARITVSDTCPDGEYDATVTYSGNTCTFKIIIGK